ncbi:MAG TPA: ribonuclease HII [Verrucomicrobiota bacterium]|nr:ribonuclease HII [Verrucomicrobiota bacterium]
MNPLPATDRLAPERELWQAGCRRFAGVDEVGRGPLAGPVVAAAVILPLGWISDGVPDAFRDLNDSKQLSAPQRESFFERLTRTDGLEFAIAQVDSAMIDAINILQASHQAMDEALTHLTPSPAHALVDGLPVPRLRMPQTALIKGDSRSYSIAAASVLAKVTRDRLMLEADARWPGYGFAKHKGYGTPQHIRALEKLGPCSIHRRSFAPLRQPELFGISS